MLPARPKTIVKFVWRQRLLKNCTMWSRCAYIYIYDTWIHIHTHIYLCIPYKFIILLTNRYWVSTLRVRIHTSILCNHAEGDSVIKWAENILADKRERRNNKYHRSGNTGWIMPILISSLKVINNPTVYYMVCIFLWHYHNSWHYLFRWPNWTINIIIYLYIPTL